MDQFSDLPVTLTSPATAAVNITPDDHAILPSVSRAIYVGQTGDLSVEMQNGEVVNFNNIQGGSMLAIRTLKVRITGTTAAGIVALW